MKLLHAIRLIALSAALFLLSTALASPQELDTIFNPNANQTVYGTAVQPDGKIISGGSLVLLEAWVATGLLG